MSKTEYIRLYNFHQAKKNQPTAILSGRRHVKQKAKGCGQILKRTRILTTVSLERIF